MTLVICVAGVQAYGVPSTFTIKPRVANDAFDILLRSKLLRCYKVPLITLTCVHRFNAKRPLDVYRFRRREIVRLTYNLFPAAMCVPEGWLGRMPKKSFRALAGWRTPFELFVRRLEEVFKHTSPEIDRLAGGLQKEGLQAVERL